jgi:hypothetical protein
LDIIGGESIELVLSNVLGIALYPSEYGVVEALDVLKDVELAKGNGDASF